MQGFKCFLDRGGRIPAVNLIQIDVVRAEPSKARVHLGHDRLARQSCPVRALMHAAMNLRRDHQFIAPAKVPQSPPDDLLAAASRIHVRRVEEVDSTLKRSTDQRPAVLLVQRPRVGATLGITEAHTAEHQSRDLKASASQTPILHGVSLFQPTTPTQRPGVRCLLVLDQNGRSVPALPEEDSGLVRNLLDALRIGLTLSRPCGRRRSGTRTLPSGMTPQAPACSPPRSWRPPSTTLPNLRATAERWNSPSEPVGSPCRSPSVASMSPALSFLVRWSTCCAARSTKQRSRWRLAIWRLPAPRAN